VAIVGPVPDDPAAVIPSSRPDLPTERGQALTGASYSNEIHVSHNREGGIGPEVIRTVSIRSQATTHRSAGEHSRLEYQPRTPAPGTFRIVAYGLTSGELFRPHLFAGWNTEQRLEHWLASVPLRPAVSNRPALFAAERPPRRADRKTTLKSPG
jgi:hypothetical protein